MTHIRPMTAADLPLGMRLSRQAGWNQAEADWQRALALGPEGCFVAEWDGRPVGTTTTAVFGDVAWIAMVLVDASLRGRGIGTALMRHALEVLDRRGVPTVRLDATPLGRPIYERLGFAAQYEIARYEGTPRPSSEVADVETAPPARWPALAALDAAVVGADRRALLARLFAEQPAGVCWVGSGEGVDGFVAARPGERAVQVGPCIASPQAGPRLLANALDRHAGRRVYVDLATSNEAAGRFAEAHGLAVQRRLTRMCRGVPRVERRDWLWASSGPEKG